MNLDAWAARWNIPPGAIHELKQLFNVIPSLPPPPGDTSESALINLLKLEASRKGARLWRNNVGAAYTIDNSFIRYGLANESTGVNTQIKSADLIGIRPVLITPKMVGWTIGQFVSREVKKSNWRYTGTDRERAQLNWAQLIMSLGGDACFATGEGTL